MTVEDAYSAWSMAYDAWQANRTPDTERALNRAADALRAARRGEWQRDGVTDATLRERFEDDEDDADDA